MKILIIKNDGIGDLILASGIISLIGEKFSTQLDLITCASNKEIAPKIKNLNSIFYISRDSIKRYKLLNTNRILVPLKKANDNCVVNRLTKTEQSIISTVNSENYDLVIVLRRYIRQSSLILLNMIQAKRKLCMWEIPTNLSYSFARRLTSNSLHLTSDHIKKYIKPELEYYEAILSLYFKQPLCANPSLVLESSNINIKELKTVGLIISGSSVKIPIEHWLILCRILNALDYNIVLFGSNEQLGIANKLSNTYPKIKNYVGLYTFEEYAHAFSKVSHIIGNDTGLTHFASLVNKNILVLLGGGTFGSFFPWRAYGPQKIIYHKMDCYNCLWTCGQIQKIQCINMIFEDYDLLMQKVKTFLSQEV